jgi:hypothetical protein
MHKHRRKARKLVGDGVEVLDQDMTRGDLVWTLERLKFAADGSCQLRLDKGVRDFLTRALRDRRQAA